MIITEISCFKSGKNKLKLCHFGLIWAVLLSSAVTHDVNASFQIIMAWFCPSYLNQNCKLTSVKKALISLATFCFLNCQAGWCKDVSWCCTDLNLCRLFTSKMTEFESQFCLCIGQNISILITGSTKTVTKTGSWNLYQTTETSLF